MGFNLRRLKKIAPGVRLNLSKKGLGASVGPAHSKLSVSPGMKITENIGIPGTGIRYTKVIKKGSLQKSSQRSRIEHEVEKTLEDSRFNRDPIDLTEWEQTNSDYEHELWFLNLVKAQKKDNSVASEFPVQSKEVVLLRAFGVLADAREVHSDDLGFIYRTTKRVNFIGMNTFFEWTFENMTIFLPYDEEQIMWFQNTDHQDLQGVQIVNDDWMKFQYFIMRAFMLGKSDLDEMLSRCGEESMKYSQTKPN